MSIDVKQELIDLIADMAVAIEASKIEDDLSATPTSLKR